MCGLLAGFGGVRKTWLKFVWDDVYVRSLVVKTPTKHVPAALGIVGLD